MNRATCFFIPDHKGTISLQRLVPRVFSPSSWQRSLNICSVKNCLSLSFRITLRITKKPQCGACLMSLTRNALGSLWFLKAGLKQNMKRSSHVWGENYILHTNFQCLWMSLYGNAKHIMHPLSVLHNTGEGLTFRDLGGGNEVSSVLPEECIAMSSNIIWVSMPNSVLGTM